MILNRSKQYALLALIDLARLPREAYALSRDLSGHLGIPQPYLSKVMQQLVRNGLLESVRGRNGGYRLARPAVEISIRQVMAACGSTEHECLLGFKACAEDKACPLHGQWRPVKEELLGLLAHLTLAQASLSATTSLDEICRTGLKPGCGRAAAHR